MKIQFLDGTEREIANLSWADLRGADLRGADLYWADLSGANLRGAELNSSGPLGADHLVHALTRAGACTEAILWVAQFPAHVTVEQILPLARPDWAVWYKENVK